MSMKSAMIIVLFLTIDNCCFAQTDPLFSTDTPLNIALTLSVREIRKTKEEGGWTRKNTNFSILIYSLFVRRCEDVRGKRKVRSCDS